MPPPARTTGAAETIRAASGTRPAVRTEPGTPSGRASGRGAGSRREHGARGVERRLAGSGVRGTRWIPRCHDVVTALIVEVGLVDAARELRRARARVRADRVARRIAGVVLPP